MNKQSQISELEKTILNILSDLNYFEEKYDASTSDFYQKFSQGYMGDGEDYIIWAGSYELLLKNRCQLAILQ